MMTPHESSSMLSTLGANENLRLLVTPKYVFGLLQATTNRKFNTETKILKKHTRKQGEKNFCVKFSSHGGLRVQSRARIKTGNVHGGLTQTCGYLRETTNPPSQKRKVHAPLKLKITT